MTRERDKEAEEGERERERDREVEDGGSLYHLINTYLILSILGLFGARL